MKTFICSGSGCAVDGGKAFGERAEAAAVVGAEDDIVLAHLVNQKGERRASELAQSIEKCSRKISE